MENEVVMEEPEVVESAGEVVLTTEEEVTCGTEEPQEEVKEAE